ncbi:hypothetical protein JYU34_018543 [Plutella xylostella]|uniref:Uncharacterized protein n=1 Tax=Plutella xylostella TaxID=51655 RepID=A0ABQ7PY24_PLUXY|nr:hypothetical protein JYU34_018543 [Plutella xylostella]
MNSVKPIDIDKRSTHVQQHPYCPFVSTRQTLRGCVGGASGERGGAGAAGAAAQHVPDGSRTGAGRTALNDSKLTRTCKIYTHHPSPGLKMSRLY